METLEIEKDGYLFSNDKSKLQVYVIFNYLSQESYWAKGIPLHLVERSIEHSECFGIYHEGQQVAFARWITDHAVFGYLADVFILPEHRGKGLSKTLMEFMLSFPELQGCRKLLLGTRDAHGLYTQYGFKPLAVPERYMEVSKKDVYNTDKPIEN